MGSREPLSWPRTSGRALIRVDGSPAIGRGHLSRCSNLAKALADIGIEATFVRAGAPDGALDGSDVRWIPDVVSRRGPRDRGPAPVAEQEADAENSLLCATPEGSPLVVVIVDQYRLDGIWEGVIRRSGLPVVVIDDLADRDHVCDLLVDQNPLGEERYEGRLLSDTMRLIGPRYALLDPDAVQGSTASQRPVGAVRRVLVNFGGSAALEPVRLALAALADPRLRDLQVDVVTGDDDSCEELIAELKDRPRPQGELEISGWVDDLPSRMRAADLAIGAGGVSNYERLHVGLPAVVLTLAPNQQESCAALHGEGLIVNEGSANDVSSDRLADAVVRLAENTEFRREIARRGPALVDGSGAARCAAAVHALIR